jgi:predicted nucleotide-binding protein
VVAALAKVFGDHTVEYNRYGAAVDLCREELAEQLAEFDGSGFFAGMKQMFYREDQKVMVDQYRAALLISLNKALLLLTEELELVTDCPGPQTRAERRYGKALPETDHVSSAVPDGRVFVVHGHDDAALQAVARAIEQLGLEPVVLREQPGCGRTIIEKFEDCADKVGFAVVLMTPDDIAGPAATPSSATRARQNVIFELGYFAGKLGRGRTCVLRKGDVEIPSDLYGVLYVELDDRGGWKLELAKELRAAGLKINMAGML